MFPLIENIPCVSRMEMEEVDRLMEQKYKISLIQMMENAGRNLYSLANIFFLDMNCKNKEVLIFAGSGGNGGGAITAGRWLQARGAIVNIYVSVKRDKLTGIPAKQIEIAEALGILIKTWPQDIDICPDLIIDGIIGYSINGMPRGNAEDMIEFINGKDARVLSLDIPSGMDPDKGAIYEKVVKADATMTLALPKKAFLDQKNRIFTGRLFLADIGVPDQLFENDIKITEIDTIFNKSGLVEIKN